MRISLTRHAFETCTKNILWRNISLYINPGPAGLKHQTPEGKGDMYQIYGNISGGNSKPKHAPVPFSKEQLKELFRGFDYDKDGRLSKEELKQAFNSLGSRVPAFRTLAALQHADENGDGFISEEELEALVQYALGLGYTIKTG